MSQRWLAQRERGSLLALRTIHWIGIRLGRRAGRILLYPIALYFLCTGARPRRASRTYLRRVSSREPGWRHLFAHVYCFAATIEEVSWGS